MLLTHAISQTWECWRPIILFSRTACEQTHTRKRYKLRDICVLFFAADKRSISIEHSKRPNCFFLGPIIPKEPFKRSKQISAGSMFRFQFHFLCVSLSLSRLSVRLPKRKKDLTHFFPFVSSFFLFLKLKKTFFFFIFGYFLNRKL